MSHASYGLTIVCSFLAAGLCPHIAIGTEPLSPAEAERYAVLDARPLHQFTNADLTDYLQLRTRSLAAAGQSPSPVENVGFFAQRALGTPFRLNAARFDLGEADCVTFVERTLALALASDWDSYYRICERLRHKDGIVAYKNRNFHTLIDWLPNNLAWGILEDNTDQLGPAGEPIAESFTHLVRPKVFEEFPAAPGSKFTRIVFKGSDYGSPAKIVAGLYVTKYDIDDVLPDLRTGDIVLILQKSSGGHLGCNHMGVVYAGSEEVSLIAGGPPEVRPVPLSGMSGYESVAGYKFLRLSGDARAAVALGGIAVTTSPPPPEREDSKVTALRAARQ